MDDILFGNNNQATINRLAKRSYRANKQRNVFVTIALFLTAFMITSVFSLGCSYFETYQMQQIRAMGTTADVAITSLSEEQYEELSRSGLVCSPSSIYSERIFKSSSLETGSSPLVGSSRINSLASYENAQASINFICIPLESSFTFLVGAM